MDTGPEIEIELYESPRPSPQAARGADKAAAMPPAQLAFACYCMVMAALAWIREGARVVGAMPAAERDAWRVSRGLAPLTVAAPAPAPAAEPVPWRELAVQGDPGAARVVAAATPATAPAVDPLTEAREAQAAATDAAAAADARLDGARAARAAWEAADLRWEAHPRDGWAGLVSPFLRGWDGTACRNAFKAAGARWDGGAKWWECRVAAMPAVEAACRQFYGRAPVAFAPPMGRIVAATDPRAASRTVTPPRGVPATFTPPAGPAGERLPVATADLPPALAARLGDTERPATERQAIPTERLALASRQRRANGGGRRTAETPEQRERRERLDAEITARRALDTAIAVALAGNPDGEYPHGCLAAWHPSGEVRWSVVADAAAAAGVSPPAERSLRAIAADAVRTIEGGGLRVSVVRRGSRWAVYRPARVTEAGASIGEAQVVAELQGDALVTSGPEDLCATVRDAFARARREAMIGSAEVTAWLTAICYGLRGVSTVYGRWIPPGRATDTWRRVTEALHAARLPLPSRPAAVASRADVAEEIAGGLRREIEAEVTRIAEDAGRENYGTRAAVSALVDLAALRDKARMYAVITGPGALDAALAQMDALAAKLEPLADDTAQRGAALELY